MDKQNTAKSSMDTARENKSSRHKHVDQGKLAVRHADRCFFRGKRERAERKTVTSPRKARYDCATCCACTSKVNGSIKHSFLTVTLVPDVCGADSEP